MRRIVRADLKGTERFKLGAQRPRPEESPLAPIVLKELENISALQEGFSRSDVQKAVQALRRAPEVMVAGARSTASLACHLWFGLTKLGIAAERVIAVTTETYDRVARLPRDAAVVVIGFPRYVRDLIDLLAFARGRGLPTITLTDNPVLPLAAARGHPPQHAGRVVLVRRVPLRPADPDQPPAARAEPGRTGSRPWRHSSASRRWRKSAASDYLSGE